MTTAYHFTLSNDELQTAITEGFAMLAFSEERPDLKDKMQAHLDSLLHSQQQRAALVCITRPTLAVTSQHPEDHV